jgi:hypothetical protein
LLSAQASLAMLEFSMATDAILMYSIVKNILILSGVDFISNYIIFQFKKVGKSYTDRPQEVNFINYLTNPNVFFYFSIFLQSSHSALPLRG